MDIPAELSLDQKESKDGTYLTGVWVPYAKRFQNLTPQSNDRLLKLIERRGYLHIEEVG